MTHRQLSPAHHAGRDDTIGAVGRDYTPTAALSQTAAPSVIELPSTRGD